jgi:hypothetical protein
VWPPHADHRDDAGGSAHRDIERHESGPARLRPLNGDREGRTDDRAKADLGQPEQVKLIPQLAPPSL